MMRKMKSRIIKFVSAVMPQNDVVVDDVFAVCEHDPKSSTRLVSQCLYAKACIQDMYCSAFNNVDHALLSRQVLIRVAKDYLETGNGYFEVIVFDGKVVAMYHIPAYSMMIKAKKDKGRKVYAQKDNEDKLFFEFDGSSLLNDGSYIIQVMNYEESPFFGAPIWLAAKKVMELVIAGEKYVAGFFDGGCVADGVLISKGSEPDDDLLDQLGEVISQRTDKGNRGVLHVNMDEESSLSYMELNKNVVDNSFILLNRDAKADICAMFGVPPKKAGLEVGRSLGGEGDFTAQLDAYYQDIIAPLQADFLAALQPALPDLVLETPKVARDKVEKSKEDEVLIGESRFRALRKALIEYV